MFASGVLATQELYFDYNERKESEKKHRKGIKKIEISNMYERFFPFRY